MGVYSKSATTGAIAKKGDQKERRTLQASNANAHAANTTRTFDAASIVPKSASTAPRKSG